MRFLLAFLLFAHGVAHLPGFFVSWRLASLPDLAYRTTIFNASLDVGPDGVRLLGLCWIGMATVLVALATAVALNVPLWRWAVPTTLAFSLLLCAAGWPDARLGLVANAAIALSLMAMRSHAVA